VLLFSLRFPDVAQTGPLGRDQSVGGLYVVPFR
jgi:hypothetical protein